MLVLLIGGHWGMLQVVAWTNMLITYSRDNSFAEAVEMTFGGEYRCAICKQIDDGIAADPGSTDRTLCGKKSVKLDAVVEVVVIETPTPRESLLPSVSRPDACIGIDLEPPRRPPRVMG